MTLSNPSVKRAIEENWVSTWHNQCPGLYCNNTADTRKPIPYPPQQLATVFEGAGGGNIRLYFCDSEGKVVHAVTGFLDVSRLLEEEEFARSQLARTAPSRQRNRVIHSPDWTDRNGFIYEHKQEILDHRENDMRRVPDGRDLWGLLREIEDNVYLKGAIG